MKYARLLQHKRLLPFAFSIIFLIYFRARYAFTIYSGGDDLAYVQWLEKFIGLPSHISFTNSSYMPGIAILWIPAGLVARLLSHGWPIELTLPPLIGLTSYLLWAGSGLFVDRIIQRSTFNNKRGLWALLWILGMPGLFYATNRTTLAHPGEMFLAFWIVDALSADQILKSVILAILLTLTRINDFPIFLLIGGYLADRYATRHALSSLSGGAQAVLALFLVAGALLTIPVGYVAFVKGYNGLTLIEILRHLSFLKIIHLIMGADWGLLYTAPAWLFIFLLGAVKWRSLSWFSRAGWIWMMLGFILCAGWIDYGVASNGMEFGYRYMIGTYAGALVVLLDLKRKGEIGRSEKWLELILCGGAAWMCYLTWVYKTNTFVTIGPLPGGGYGNPLLQWEALCQLAHPVRIVRPLFLSPPVTLLHSLLMPHNPFTSKYALSGFPLFILGLASTIAVIVLAWAL